MAPTFSLLTDGQEGGSLNRCGFDGARYPRDQKGRL